MPQPFNSTGDGLPAGPVPDTTAAGRRAAGGTGPGVPLSIWPGLPDPGGARDGVPCGGPVTTAAARRVIDAFSRPGDLIAVPAGSPAVTQAAAAAGRRVLTLTLTPGRDPGRQRPGVPAALPPSGDPDTGTATLAIAGYCGSGCSGRHPGGPGGDLNPGPVFAACERVLRPGGVLAVITSPAAPGGTLTDTAGSVVVAARAAGLVYAQHIILVRAAIDGDRLVPAGPGPGPAAPGGRAVHDDLVVFTKPGTPVSPQGGHRL
jgi:hypothetical protein